MYFMDIVKAEIDKYCKKVQANPNYKNNIDYDSKGYFLIRINTDKKEIELAFCKELNIISLIISGKTAEEVYHAFFNQGITIKLDHAAYLGKELEKAEFALKLGIQYIQDSPLDLTNSIK
jgi:tetrahydromethanopterin S-methyltransferase subunit A